MSVLRLGMQTELICKLLCDFTLKTCHSAFFQQNDSELQLMGEFIIDQCCICVHGLYVMSRVYNGAPDCTPLAFKAVGLCPTTH